MTPPTDSRAPVLTLDGPSGTGKGTVGRLVAGRLGWHYLDSGAVYRLLGLIAEDRGISPEDADQLHELSTNLDIEFSSDPDDPGVWCNGVDISERIRTESCGEIASRFAAVPEVREILLELQRATRRIPGLVADGRDMGTVVFPDAEVKVYLDASPGVRAERRYKQLKEKGSDVNLARLHREMAARDERDANRSVSPLSMAKDACRIDTSAMTIDEVVAAVLELVTSCANRAG